jgi:hypothetical protein
MKFTLLEAQKGMSQDDLIDLINENERRRNSMLGNFQFPAPTALVTKINDFRNHTP